MLFQNEILKQQKRGALFETLAVAEALKWQAAFAVGQPVHYWRDNIGNEIDVLLERPDGLTLVEVKAGQTFQGEWLKGLDTVARHIGEPVRRAWSTAATQAKAAATSPCWGDGIWQRLGDGGWT